MGIAICDLIDWLDDAFAIQLERGVSSKVYKAAVINKTEII